MAGHVAVLLAFVVVLVSNSVFTSASDVFHKKFEYKYSFKGPYLAQRDGSVPFWEYGGSCIASEESVRLTPSLKSKKGFIWSKNQTTFPWWEIEFVFRVTGRGRVGADGLAFWFTEHKGLEGPVFGSSDQWRGLGIFFDSFDNDNKHNNPYIMAMVNDGTMMFDHPNDGSNQQLAGCLRDYRNKPFPVRAKIEYKKNTLTVMFHSGMTASEQDYEVCLRVENVHLPLQGYFGLSAATGGLADDHDVLKFLAYSLTSTDTAPVQQVKIDEMEKERIAKEFEKYRQQLEQQKEDYRKEHPDARKIDEDDDEWFEGDNQRELRQIFMGQSQMFDVLRELHRKLDEVIGRQERTLSMLSTGGGGMHQGQVPPPPQQGGHLSGGGQPQIAGDGIRRHEVDAVLNNQREIVGAAREIKAFVTEIHQKSNTIMANQQKTGGTGGGGVQTGYDMQALVNEMKDGLNAVKRDLSSIASKSTGGCPEQIVPSCLTPTIFLVFLGIQSIIMLGYFFYRDGKEAQAKKFY